MVHPYMFLTFPSVALPYGRNARDSVRHVQMSFSKRIYI